MFKPLRNKTLDGYLQPLAPLPAMLFAQPNPTMFTLR
jgi:hypothetical protein